MRKVFILILFFFIFVNTVLADDSLLLKGSVVKVPDNFFGSWRVVSKLVDTDSPFSFKSKGVDIWNLSLENNVIKLSNPFSGAVAELKIEEASQNSVVFTKIGNYNGKVLTDRVVISIEGDRFSGTNNLKLDTFSDVDDSIRKTENAKYTLYGEKISGQSVIEY